MEHSNGELVFVAPRSRVGTSGDIRIDAQQTEIFEQDISYKVHAIRNQGLSSVPEIDVKDGEELRSVSLDLGGREEKVLQVNAPSDSVVTNWAAVTDNSQITATVSASTLLNARVTASNQSDTAQTGKLSVTGTVKVMFSANAEVRRRPASIDVWGVVPYRNLPEWMADRESIEQELSRRDTPLSTATVDAPLTSAISSWAFLEPGSLMILHDNDLTLNMMVGRKYITLSKTPSLRFHLVEFPINYPDEYWILDSPNFELGINTYLSNEIIPTTGHNLIYHGDRLVYHGDRPTYF